MIKILFLLGFMLTLNSAQNVAKTIRLNDGNQCPIIGLGTGRQPQDSVVQNMVYDAIAIGYRHIDTAAIYGNEKPIGHAVNDLVQRRRIKREDIFITTKIFYKEYPEDNYRTNTVKNVHLAKQKLNLDYIDLMLIHWPHNDSKINSEIWGGLEDARYQGVVKSIGVSNFNIEQLSELLTTVKIIPVMNQIQSNPKNNNRELIDFCKQRGIAVTAYSPLGKGTLVDDPTLIEIGKRHNKTSAQVMIRWQIQRGVIPIPKSSKTNRIQENFNVFDFNLSEDDMKLLENFEVLTNSAFSNVLSINLIFYCFIHLLFLLYK